MKIIHFVNDPVCTPFAATWSFFIMEDIIKDQIDTDMIANTILKNEKSIINQYEYIDDWGTGLGPNSLTSRSGSFNLLSWPELEHLKIIIKDTYDRFLTGINLVPEKTIYINCWANVMRTGESIKQHRHWSTNMAYLGGHICIRQFNTKTYYKHPFTNINHESFNEPGKITLFPNWLEHGVDKHTGEEERITIAFDIITQYVLDNDIKEHKKSQWIPITN